MNGKKLLATLCSLSMMIGTSNTKSKVSARSTARTVGAVSCGVISGVSLAGAVGLFVEAARIQSAINDEKNKPETMEMELNNPLEFLVIPFIPIGKGIAAGLAEAAKMGCLIGGAGSALISVISGLAGYLFARPFGNSDENAKILEKTENSK